MEKKNQTGVLNIVCVVLVLLSGIIRMTRHHYSFMASNSLTGILFFMAVLIWIYQIRRRLVRPQERKYLTWTAILFLLLLFIRTIKYIFLPAESAAGRYAWYLYYFPQNYTVLLMFFAVLHIDRPYDKPVCRAWKLLYIPAGLLTFGILTNDVHQMAFRFPMGVEKWTQASYVHGPLYFLSLAWLLGLFTAMLVVSLKHCAVPEKRKNLWMPLLPLAVGVLYIVCFFIDSESVFPKLFKTTEMICFVFPAFMEGLIQAGLFPTNKEYDRLWNASSLGFGIMDRNGKICYQSEMCIPVDFQEIRSAAEKPLLLKNGNIMLQSHEVHGGYGYWIKDISEINKKNRQLQELADTLSEENAMLEGENRLEEKRNRIIHKNQIFDRISGEVTGQLDSLDRMLDSMSEDDEIFEKQIKYGGILIAYIKRYANLLLLAQDAEKISASELGLALEESLQYVRLYGVRGYGEYDKEGELPAKMALTLYRFFECVLEACAARTNTIFVRVFRENNDIYLYMEVNISERPEIADLMYEEIQKSGAELQLEHELDTEFITLVFRGTKGEK